MKLTTGNKTSDTLLSCLLVLVNLSIVTGIMVRGFLRAQYAAAESSAIATVRTLVRSEKTFKELCIKDEDGDGVGEYGSMEELCRVAQGASNEAGGPPPVLEKSILDGSSDYRFEILVGDENTSGPDAIDASEQFFFVRAWPTENARERDAHRSFFADQSVVIYGKSIAGNPPQPEARQEKPPWPKVLHQ